MKFYEAPIADVILLDVEDILTSSSSDPTINDNLGDQV